MAHRAKPARAWPVWSLTGCCFGGYWLGSSQSWTARRDILRTSLPWPVLIWQGGAGSNPGADCFGGTR